MLQEINKELLIALNSLTKYDFIQRTVLFFVDSPIFFLPIFFLSLWLYYSYKKSNLVVSEILPTRNLLEKENLLYIFYSIVIWLLISLTIQHFVHIERPEVALKWVWMLLLKHIPDASFPSDHATVSVAFLSGLFFAWYKKTGLYYAPFVILMLLSRVIVWVHWPFDIIGGAFIWFFSSYITFKYVTKMKIVNMLNQFIIKLMWYIKM